MSPQKYSKPRSNKKIFAREFRLQGTDGIRREVKLSSSQEATSLSPQEVFLKLGFITEEFMEIYAYAHIKQLMSTGKIQTGDSVVLGGTLETQKEIILLPSLAGYVKQE